MLSHLRNSQRQKTHVCDYTLRIFILRYKFHVSKQCCICQLSIINKEIIEYPKSEEIQQRSLSPAPWLLAHSITQCSNPELCLRALSKCSLNCSSLGSCPSSSGVGPFPNPQLDLPRHSSMPFPRVLSLSPESTEELQLP